MTLANDDDLEAMTDARSLFTVKQLLCLKNPEHCVIPFNLNTNAVKKSCSKHQQQQQKSQFALLVDWLLNFVDCKYTTYKVTQRFCKFYLLNTQYNFTWHIEKSNKCHQSLVPLLLAFVVLLLLGKDDQQTAENADDIVEQIHSVGDTIVATHTVLLHDHLGIEQYKSGHHCQADVQCELLYKVGSEQQISQTDEGHCTECAEQDTSEEQVASTFRQHCRCAQAGEDGGCSNEGRDDDGRVDEHDLFQH